MAKVLVTGGTGAVGREVVRLLVADGHHVRLLVRNPERARESGAAELLQGDAMRAEDARRATDGMDILFSALGASVSLTVRSRLGYLDVDVPAHRNLVEAARTGGIRRIVYVSAHAAPGYAHTNYVQAHVQVEELIRAAGFSSTMVRPTGVFTALADLVGMAARGMASTIGDGSATSNPVHPTCLAEQCVKHMEDGPDAVSVGGPEVLTRRQMVERAFLAVGRKPRIMAVPAGMVRAVGGVTRLFNPRLGELVQFAAAVSVTHSVAPQLGTRTLDAYFADVARGMGLGPARVLENQAPR